MTRFLTWLFTHAVAIVVGFALGIYFLPILTAPLAPSVSEVSAVMKQSRFTGEFTRELEGSDFLHWGEGTVAIGESAISLEGSIAPGPDYVLYLTSEFVQTESEFTALKSEALAIGPVKTFDNFIIPVDSGIDVTQFNTVVVWCESFSEFITAAKYQ